MGFNVSDIVGVIWLLGKGVGLFVIVNISLNLKGFSFELVVIGSWVVKVMIWVFLGVNCCFC